ncbi:MAG: hypothetical protein ACR2PV_05300, partial [Gammaproteobacteria bacterium]
VELLLTVGVSAALAVEDASGNLFLLVNSTVIQQGAVELSGVGGIPPYTFTLLPNNHFEIDKDGKNFRVTTEFQSASELDVEYILEDSDLERTPAVSGTIKVFVTTAR